MRIRSYQFFEVWTGLNTPNETREYRGSEEGARAKLALLSMTADENKGNVYLFCITLIEAHKADKK